MLHPSNVDGYSVICDSCNGKMFTIGGRLCPKCQGDGRIFIREDLPLTFSRRVARQMLWIVFGAAIMLSVAIAALHWLRLL